MTHSNKFCFRFFVMYALQDSPLGSRICETGEDTKIHFFRIRTYKICVTNLEFGKHNSRFNSIKKWHNKLIKSELICA
jgi:hypothetical protein